MSDLDNEMVKLRRIVELENQLDELQEELRELIEQWRQREQHMTYQSELGYASGIKECIDELEAVLDE